MSQIVDDLLNAIEIMKRVEDLNPVVRIDVSMNVYELISKECRARKDETMVDRGFLGIPVHIKDDLPTECRIYREDGSIEDY